MSNLNIYLGNGFIIIGLFFIITAQIGVIRLKIDFLTKIHATSIADSLGFSLCFIGVGLINLQSNITGKYFLLALILLLVSTMSTHSIAKFYTDKEKANLAEKNE